MSDSSTTLVPGQYTRLAFADDGGVIITTIPGGQGDGTAVREVYEAAAALTDRRNIRMLVDLSDLNHVSSGMMGILVAVKKKFLHFGGQLIIVVPNSQVMEQFQLMNLHLVLKIHNSIEEAKAAFKA